jgi:hypothetical protein
MPEKAMFLLEYHGAEVTKRFFPSGTGDEPDIPHKFG